MPGNERGYSEWVTEIHMSRPPQWRDLRCRTPTQAQDALFQDRLVRGCQVHFAPREALFLRGGDDPAVVHQDRRNALRKGKARLRQSAAGRLSRQHCKHLKSTNMLERLNQQIKRRTWAVRIFPNAESCLRLVRAHRRDT